MITPLTGKNAGEQEIVLEDATIRKGAFCRYKMEIKMVSTECVEVQITDLGFGELFPSTGKVWTKQFNVV